VENSVDSLPSDVIRSLPFSTPASYLPAMSMNLASVHTGMCVDAAGGSMSLGTPVIQYPCHTGSPQRWFLQPRNDISSGDVWDVIRNSGGASRTFAPLGVQGFTPNWGSLTTQSAGAWRIANQNAQGFVLQPFNNTAFCLDVPGWTQSVAQLNVWGCTGNPNQRWRIQN
jgi:peptidyl-Asp metalloendopeptidase